MADQAVTEGNALVVEYRVTNQGDTVGTQTIELQIDGTTEDSQSSVELEPEESRRGILAWQTESGDAQAADYTATVVTEDREASITVNVS